MKEALVYKRFFRFHTLLWRRIPTLVIILISIGFFKA